MEILSGKQEDEFRDYRASPGLEAMFEQLENGYSGGSYVYNNNNNSNDSNSNSNSNCNNSGGSGYDEEEKQREVSRAIMRRLQDKRSHEKKVQSYEKKLSKNNKYGYIPHELQSVKLKIHRNAAVKTLVQVRVTIQFCFCI